MTCAEEDGQGEEQGSDWGNEEGVFSDGDTLSEWGGTDDSHSGAQPATVSPARHARALMSFSLRCLSSIMVSSWMGKWAHINRLWLGHKLSQ